MAESALISLIFKLEARIEHEVGLDQVIKDKARYIIEEVQSMQHFLREADECEDPDHTEKPWIKQVRDAAFESEDIIDRFLHHLASTGSCWVKVKKLVARHDIYSMLLNIETKYKTISERKARYQTSQVSTNIREKSYNAQEDAHFIKEADLVGVDKPKNDLIQLLVHEALELKFLSVVGMGGLGKTTLVKQVHEAAKVKKHFQNHAWITVSRTYKTDDLLKDLIRQLCKENKQLIPAEMEAMDSLRLKQELQNEILKDERYIIVVDDVWSTDAWNEIRNAFPDCNRGSRVIITTRKTDVASKVSQDPNRDKIYRLKPLSEEQSMTLLCKMTSISGSLPDYLKEASKSILKKCAGLPLAIVAISGVLINKNMNTDAEWKKIDERLGLELGDNPDLTSIKNILLLSYYDLPYYLKSCFLYLGIFPEDHLIGRRKLVRMWIAEGFADKAVDDEHTAEDVAKRYLKDLLTRNLIQVAERRSDGMAKTYLMHDLLREMVIKVIKNQNFATVLNDKTRSFCEKVRRISVHSHWLSNCPNQNLHHLRSFFMFEVGQPLTHTTMPFLFSDSFKLLVVLDLQGTDLSKFPPSITSQLFNLRYLSLKDTKIDRIPSSIGNLKILETLDLKGTSVSKLPKQILKLQQLRNLLVYRNHPEGSMTFVSKQGFKAPNGVGCFKSLRALCFIEAGEDNAGIVQEVGNLIALRRLGIVKLSKGNNKSLCTSLGKLNKLHALSITCSESDNINLEGLADPLMSLRRLYLTGKLESFTIWMEKLRKLVKIFLKASSLPNDPLVTLEQLPDLVHIELRQVFNGREMHFRDDKFKKLKNLGLHELESLERVVVDKKAMPNLERFILQGCGSMRSLPTGIEHLSTLKVLDFVYMPEELITTIQALPSQIQHIPEVNFVRIVDGVLDNSRLTQAKDGISESNDVRRTNTMQRLNAFIDK